MTKTVKTFAIARRVFAVILYAVVISLLVLWQGLSAGSSSYAVYGSGVYTIQELFCDIVFVIVPGLSCFLAAYLFGIVRNDVWCSFLSMPIGLYCVIIGSNDWTVAAKDLRFEPAAWSMLFLLCVFFSIVAVGVVGILRCFRGKRGTEQTENPDVLTPSGRGLAKQIVLTLGYVLFMCLLGLELSIRFGSLVSMFFGSEPEQSSDLVMLFGIFAIAPSIANVVTADLFCIRRPFVGRAVASVAVGMLAIGLDFTAYAEVFKQLRSGSAAWVCLIPLASYLAVIAMGAVGIARWRKAQIIKTEY